MLRRLLSSVSRRIAPSTYSTTQISNQAKHFHFNAAAPSLSAYKPPLTISPYKASSPLTPKLAITTTAFNGNRFFSINHPQCSSSSSPLVHRKNNFYAPPYISGPLVTPAFVNKNKRQLESSKQELKLQLTSANSENKDLSEFVDCLFNLEKSSKLIQKIDFKTKKILSKKDPELFHEYQAMGLENNQEKLTAFLKTRFLPTLRIVFQDLAKHYGFDAALVETNDGLLLDDDYMDFISQGKLILDLGEDAHGPFPHIIAAFMMKELELEGQLSSAPALYQSLSQRSNHYCPHRMNFDYHFLLLLDFPNEYPLTSTLFCNPSSLANHLLFNCDALKQFATVCKNHSSVLAKLSRDAWDQEENKHFLSKGKVSLG